LRKKKEIEEKRKTTATQKEGEESHSLIKPQKNTHRRSAERERESARERVVSRVLFSVPFFSLFYRFFRRLRKKKKD
jgi:hypothetical protein